MKGNNLKINICYNLIILTILFDLILLKKPVIGMYGLVEPISDYYKYTKEAIDGGFVRWMEASGAEVVVIHIWYNHEQIISLLNQINGVLFSAGPRRPLKFDEPWESTGKFIFDYAKNNSIPIWGTCLGMQMLTVYMSDENTNFLEEYNSIGLKNVPLTDSAKESKMLSLFKENDFYNFNNSQTSYHIHKHGISPGVFFSYKNLIDNFDIIGYGYDNDGKKFVNVIESKKGKKHKIFGTQFHPEKNPFERGNWFKEKNPMDALRRSQLIVMKFVEEARNNGNKFINNEKINKYTFINTYEKLKIGTYNKSRNYYYFEKKDF